MLPPEYLLRKTKEVILTHPLIHWLAYFRKHKTHSLKVHIFEVTHTIEHRITTTVFLDSPVSYDELIVIICYTWDCLEYFALVVPGHFNPFLLPEYPTLQTDLLESIILPNFYRFQVREYIHEARDQPLIIDFNDRIFTFNYGGNSRRQRGARRLSGSL